MLVEQLLIFFFSWQFLHILYIFSVILLLFFFLLSNFHSIWISSSCKRFCAQNGRKENYCFVCVNHCRQVLLLCDNQHLYKCVEYTPSASNAFSIYNSNFIAAWKHKMNVKWNGFTSDFYIWFVCLRFVVLHTFFLQHSSLPRFFFASVKITILWSFLNSFFLAV